MLNHLPRPKFFLSVSIPDKVEGFPKVSLIIQKAGQE